MGQFSMEILSPNGSVLGETQQISAIEQAQSAMPTRENMHELELNMEQLKGQLQVMSQRLAGYSDIMTRVEVVVARHEEHLLKAK